MTIRTDGARTVSNPVPRSAASKVFDASARIAARALLVAVGRPCDSRSIDALIRSAEQR